MVGDRLFSTAVGEHAINLKFLCLDTAGKSVPIIGRSPLRHSFWPDVATLGHSALVCTHTHTHTHAS